MGRKHVHISKGKEVNIEDLSLISAFNVGRKALDVLRTFEGMEKKEQLAGYAICFLIACERIGMRPQRVMEAADNIMTRAEDVIPEIRALRMYAQGEL